MVFDIPNYHRMDFDEYLSRITDLKVKINESVTINNIKHHVIANDMGIVSIYDRFHETNHSESCFPKFPKFPNLSSHDSWDGCRQYDPWDGIVKNSDKIVAMTVLAASFMQTVWYFYAPVYRPHRTGIGNTGIL